MVDCHFCKVSIQTNEAFIVKSPEGDSDMMFCSDCMGDILKLFKSGEAEKQKINGPKLEIYDHQLFVKDSEGRRQIRNVEIKRVDRQSSRNYLSHNPNQYSNQFAPTLNNPYYQSGHMKSHGYEFVLEGFLFENDGIEETVPF